MSSNDPTRGEARRQLLEDSSQDQWLTPASFPPGYLRLGFPFPVHCFHLGQVAWLSLALLTRNMQEGCLKFLTF